MEVLKSINKWRIAHSGASKILVLGLPPSPQHTLTFWQSSGLRAKFCGSLFIYSCVNTDGFDVGNDQKSVQGSLQMKNPKFFQKAHLKAPLINASFLDALSG